MKKVLLIMAAALMTMTQCRKQETVPAMPSANTIKMTITAGPGAKTDITNEGRIKWTSGDVLYVSNGTNWLGSLDLVGEGGSPSGTFTGDISEISDGTTCHFFYLGHDNGMEEPTSTNNAVISFASQDGTDEGAFKYHLGHGIAKVTVSGGVATGAVAMTTEIAIARLKLKMNGEDYTGSVTMDVSNTMTVRPDGTFSGSGNGIDIGNNGGTSDGRYVTLIPTGTESVEVSFSGSATGSLTFGHGIQANNLYGMSKAIEVTLTREVDLGLPSGLKWATCNLGASSPEEYGDYYAWGATTTWYQAGYAQESPQSHWKDGYSDGYAWPNCPFTNGTYTSSNKKVFTKYVPTGKTDYWAGSGDPDNKLVLDPEDDAARANWGGSWRMPTEEEFQELINNTTKTWTTVNGVGGWKCANKSDATKYIFLPATGFRSETSLTHAGSYGYYWSSSLNTSYPRNGRSLSLNSNSFGKSSGYRCYGYPVRPVCPTQPQN